MGAPAEELRQVLDASQVITDAGHLERVRCDATGVTAPGSPAVLVRPRNTSEVQEVLRIAHRDRIPVTVRGAGTGLSGAATAAPDGIVLETTGMDRILEINATDKVAVVQPGVITADLHRAALGSGLWYAPDPASCESSTIGGNIATDAGGLHCVKYGVTGASVLALEVVLADGEVIRTGHRSLKGVTGLDLTHLFVGSEGVLGVVTEATLRLRTVPGPARTMLVWCPDLARVGAVVAAIARSGVQPSALELIDHGSLETMDATRGTKLSHRGDSLVIVQTDDPDATDRRSRIMSALSDLGVGTEAVEDVEAEWYLTQRRLPRPTPAGWTALKEDVAVPVSRLTELLTSCQAAASRNGVRFECLAHAGDGNVHAKLLAPLVGGRPDPALHIAADEIVATALRLGGTLTGEHGVGLLKRPWLEQELGTKQLDLQHGIKRLFDPRGILNPLSFLSDQEMP